MSLKPNKKIDCYVDTTDSSKNKDKAKNRRAITEANITTMNSIIALVMKNKPSNPQIIALLMDLIEKEAEKIAYYDGQSTEKTKYHANCDLRGIKGTIDSLKNLIDLLSSEKNLKETIIKFKNALKVTWEESITLGGDFPLEQRFRLTRKESRRKLSRNSLNSSKGSK